jgi:DNA-binding XRE family transcriptional regulator
MQHPFTRYRKEHIPPLTKADLSRLLGVTRSCVSRIETGERLVGIKLLRVVVKRTGLSVATLRPDLDSLWRNSK